MKKIEEKLDTIIDLLEQILEELIDTNPTYAKP